MFFLIVVIFYTLKPEFLPLTKIWMLDTIFNNERDWTKYAVICEFSFHIWDLTRVLFYKKYRVNRRFDVNVLS
ncbi:hypothetical protein AUR65_004890 [Haloferax marisrubri]|uniref:Uncharacterized protein n=1 Tax=Haloferax marisrubri TaxID=1544719 RepID=A0A2P4NTD9_9EURY|nr:hypothetical protein AUR65_004890 [Haloferax marisrubri]